MKERTYRPHGEWERITQMQEVRRIVCDCGYELGVDERDSFFGTRLAKMPNYCPNCGARIEVGA
jgi:DNA-directed RNA polymerase subunit RPC12/RpoP